jgi:hypothetical protein
LGQEARDDPMPQDALGEVVRQRPLGMFPHGSNGVPVIEKFPHQGSGLFMRRFGVFDTQALEGDPAICEAFSQVLFERPVLRDVDPRPEVREPGQGGLST